MPLDCQCLHLNTEQNRHNDKLEILMRTGLICSNYFITFTIQTNFYKPGLN